MNEVVFHVATDTGKVLDANGHLVPATSYVSLEYMNAFVRTTYPHFMDIWAGLGDGNETLRDNLQMRFLNVASIHPDSRFQTRYIGRRKFSQIIHGTLNTQTNLYEVKIDFGEGEETLSLPLGVTYFEQELEWGREEAIVPDRTGNLTVAQRRDYSGVIPSPLKKGTCEYAIRAAKTGTVLLGDHPATHSSAEDNRNADGSYMYTFSSDGEAGIEETERKLGQLERKTKYFRPGNLQITSNYHSTYGRVATGANEGQLDIYPEADYHFIHLIDGTIHDVESDEGFYSICW